MPRFVSHFVGVLLLLGAIGAQAAQLRGTEADAASTFLAAAVQHVPVGGATAQEAQMNNLAIYQVNARQAADAGAKVVVFPEFGLYDKDFTKLCTSPAGIAPYCQAVPGPAAPGDAEVVPCADDSFGPVVAATSCMARNASIITSVNLCETAVVGGETKYFNTQLVVDEGGAVVAKYRKTHVWDTDCFAEPAEPDYVMFKSSFGVEFGVFTCKDILYPTPGPVLHSKYGINHFLYSAAIPIVGAPAEELWTWMHGSAMVAGNLGIGESGIFVKGKRESPKPGAGNQVILGAVPYSV